MGWTGCFPTALASTGKRLSSGEAAMKPKMEPNIGSLAVIGVDIGKEVFHIVGLGVDGKIAFRRKIR